MKQKEQKRKIRIKTAGFTLVELLVAFAILAIVVTPFLLAFLTSTRMNAALNVRENALTAAGQRWSPTTKPAR